MQDATGPDEIIEASPPILVNQPHSLAIVKAAADVVWIVSARGDRIVDASGWREFTGQTDEEMQHGGWMRAVHPDDRRRTLRAWIGAVGRSASVEIEHRIRRRDGAYRTMRLRAIPVSDDRGQLREWVGMHTDETEQIAVRESLLASGESFRKLAEDLPQLVWTADANGAKTYCNQRYLNYTGALSVDEIDRSWLTYVHPDDRASAAHAWQRSLATGEPYECEYRFRRFDGSYRAFLARATAARDHQGRIVGWVGSGTDVHERKQLEAAMRKSEKLAIAGRLAANISHELNNPLAAALNTLYLALQDQNLSESSRMYVKLAEGQLKRIARLTRQTLRFHRQSSEPVLADLCAIMDSVLDAAAPENTPGVAAERQYHDSRNSTALPKTYVRRSPVSLEMLSMRSPATAGS